MTLINESNCPESKTSWCWCKGSCGAQGRERRLNPYGDQLGKWRLLFLLFRGGKEETHISEPGTVLTTAIRFNPRHHPGGSFTEQRADSGGRGAVTEPSSHNPSGEARPGSRGSVALQPTTAQSGRIKAHIWGSERPYFESQLYHTSSVTFGGAFPSGHFSFFICTIRS